MKSWESIRGSKAFHRCLGNDSEWIAYWTRTFDKTYQGAIDTWDYQWILSTLIHGGLVVSPAANMVRNLGFGVEATHTRGHANPLGSLECEELALPLAHPKRIRPCRPYDEFLKQSWCGIRRRSRLSRLRRRIGRAIRGVRS
jgi:hypothetical protein